MILLKVCHTFNQRIRTSRRRVRDWLMQCGAGWASLKSTGGTARSAGGTLHQQKLQPTGNFFPFRGISALLLRPFNWLNQAHPDGLG